MWTKPTYIGALWSKNWKIPHIQILITPILSSLSPSPSLSLSTPLPFSSFFPSPLSHQIKKKIRGYFFFPERGYVHGNWNWRVLECPTYYPLTSPLAPFPLPHPIIPSPHPLPATPFFNHPRLTCGFPSDSQKNRTGKICISFFWHRKKANVCFFLPEWRGCLLLRDVR